MEQLARTSNIYTKWRGQVRAVALIFLSAQHQFLFLKRAVILKARFLRLKDPENA
jgi:hypothetical protein